MRIIGIHGRARTGKDETAQILVKMFGFKQIVFANTVKEMAIKYFGMTHESVFEKKNKESRMILQGIGQTVRDNLTGLHDIFNMETPPDITKINPLNNLPFWVSEFAVEDFGVPPAYLNCRRKNVKKILYGIYNLFLDNTEEFYSTAKGKGENFWINHLFNKHNEDVVYVASDVRYANEKKVVEDNDGYVIKITRTDETFIEHGPDHPSETELDMETDWFYHIQNDHKGSWRENLVRQSANMVRKLDSENFFTKEDKEKFKINIKQHE